MKPFKTLAAIAVTLLAASTHAAPTVVVGIPDTYSADCDKKTRDLLRNLARKLPADSKVLVYNATTQTRLAEAIIPDTTPEGRERLVGRKLTSVWRHLAKPQSVQSGSSVDQIDLPGLTRNTAAMIKAGGEIRLIIVASPYGTSGELAFRAGQVASLDAIEAKSSDSPYGTADLKGTLDKVQVDWLIVDSTSTARQVSFVSGFYKSYLQALGANLATFLPSVDETASRAVTNASDSAAGEAPPQTGRIEIIDIPSLNEKKAAGPADPAPPVASGNVEKPAQTFTVRADEQKKIETPVTLFLLFDGSQSNGKALEAGARLSVEIAKLGPKLIPDYSLAVAVHRGKGLINQFGPARIETEPDSAGLTELQTFISKPCINAERVASSEGEIPGASTGEKVQLTPFETTIGTVDLSEAVTKAIDSLETTPSPRRRVLVVVGDMSTDETDGLPGTSDVDREAEQRLFKAVQQFLNKNPDARIVSVYTGDSTTDGATKPFFEKLASLAGGRGIALASLDDMPGAVKQAILNP